MQNVGMHPWVRYGAQPDGCKIERAWISEVDLNYVVSTSAQGSTAVCVFWHVSETQQASPCDSMNHIPIVRTTRAWDFASHCFRSEGTFLFSPVAARIRFVRYLYFYCFQPPFDLVLGSRCGFRYSSDKVVTAERPRDREERLASGLAGDIRY